MSTACTILSRSRLLRRQPKHFLRPSGHVTKTTATQRGAVGIGTVAITTATIFPIYHGFPWNRRLFTTDCEAVNNGGVELELFTTVKADEDSSLVHRILQWLQQIFKNCRDLTLVAIRATEIVVSFSPLLILGPTSYIGSHIWGTSDNRIADITWWYVIQTVQRLGPCYVKLCQWIATRRDLFPPIVCDRLSALHDKAFPHLWKHTQSILKEAFGEDYEQKGLVVKKDAIIGCGSAAQVYQGTLTEKDAETGKTVERQVAVKILHPKLKANVDRDLWLLEQVAALLHSLPIERIRMMNMPRATNTFANILKRQTDLTVEADNLRRFRANFYKNAEQEARSEITFPRPMDNWTGEKVLVEELVHNASPIALSLQDSTKEGRRIRKQLGSQLFRAFLKMVFLDNFVHADLHPGNVFVRKLGGDEVVSSFSGSAVENKIVFLDAGIAFALDPNDQKNLRDLFRAVVLNDGKTAGRLMVERAKYERCSQMENGVEEFSTAMHELVEEFHNRRKGGLTFGAVKIGSLLNRVLDLCRDYGVEIDPAMSGVVISCIVLEGLARSLEPSLNLIDTAIPFVIGMGRV